MLLLKRMGFGSLWEPLELRSMRDRSSSKGQEASWCLSMRKGIRWSIWPGSSRPRFCCSRATVPATAALYLLLAVLLWRAERNWFVGIRTPWTLSDERVWNRTHRHVAPLFALAAVLAIGGLLFPDYAIPLLTVPVLVVSLWSMLYSFLLFRRLDRA